VAAPVDRIVESRLSYGPSEGNALLRMTIGLGC